MPTMKMFKCNWCKGLFEARTADRARGWARFCSKHCKASHQSVKGGNSPGHVTASKEQIEEEMHQQALYDAFGSHGQDGF